MGLSEAGVTTKYLGVSSALVALVCVTQWVDWFAECLGGWVVERLHWLAGIYKAHS